MSPEGLAGLEAPEEILDHALPRDLVNLYLVGGRIGRSHQSLLKAAERGEFPTIWNLGSGQYAVQASLLREWAVKRQTTKDESLVNGRKPRGGVRRISAEERRSQGA